MPMMKADGPVFVVMLARHRSATNTLEAVLETHPAIFCTREVIHPAPAEHAHLEVARNYFRFLERYPAATLIRARASDEAQEELFLD